MLISIFNPALIIVFEGLIQLRNELAYYLQESSEKAFSMTGCDAKNYGIDGGLPRILNDERTCGFCEQRLNCCLYQR